MRVTGLVQGVFFRAGMAAVAQGLGVAGWVTNREDGSVEALLEGEADAVEAVVAWSRRGPPKARVESVLLEEEAVQNVEGFKVAG